MNKNFWIGLVVGIGVTALVSIGVFKVGNRTVSLQPQIGFGSVQQTKLPSPQQAQYTCEELRFIIDGIKEALANAISHRQVVLAAFFRNALKQIQAKHNEQCGPKNIPREFE